MSTFKDFLLDEKAKTQTAIIEFFKDNQTELQNLGDDSEQMFEKLKNFSTHGGKMIRPTLVRLAYQLSGKQETQELIKASISIEILHRFLLIHDDLVDRDQIRHGQPNIENQYDQSFTDHFPKLKKGNYASAMAMIAGDLEHCFAYDVILNTNFDPQTKLDTIRAINACMYSTAAGWVLETNLKYTELSLVKKENIERAMDLVSAKYSVLWPLRIGQVLAEKGFENWSKDIDEYAQHVGLAFQIQDDILGLLGDEKITGKPVGRDLEEGKKSLLLLYAFQAANEKDKQVLSESLLQKVDPIDFNQVKNIIEQTGAIHQVRQESKEHIKKALNALEQVKGDSKTIGYLRCMAEFLADREY